MPWLTALVLIAFGVAVLVGGTRLWLLGAAVGALLGIGLITLFPGEQNGWLPFILVAVLAAGLGILAVVFKGFVNLALMAIGFIAGGAIVISLLDALSLQLGLIAWILALLGGLVGVVIVSRFKEWAFIILAALVGALLVVRGVQIIIPATGVFALLLGVVAAGGGIYYHMRGGKRG